MSTTAATARAPRTSAPYRTERAHGPRLEVLTAPARSRSQLPFALACVTLLAASLIGLLLLNISLSRGSYEVHALQGRATELAEREQVLTEQLAARAAPAQLSQEARALGMVPGTTPAFLRLSDGAVLGSAVPAPQSPAPGTVVGARALPAAPLDLTPQAARAAAAPAVPSAPRAATPNLPPAASLVPSQAPAPQPAPRPAATAEQRPEPPAQLGDGAVPVRP